MKNPDSSSRWRHLWVLVLTLLMGLLLGRHFAPAGSSSPEREATDQVISTASVTAPAPSANVGVGAQPSVPGSGPASAPVVHEPLPPFDVPLTMIEPTLLQRLYAGDASAGCRLAVELRRCAMHLRARDYTRHLISRAVRDENDGRVADVAAQSAAQFEEREQVLGPVCEGVGRESFDRYHDVLLRTTRLGDTRAMVDFATQAGSLGAEYARYPERLAVWHEQAQGWIEQALRAGEVSAVLPLLLARHGTSAGLLGELLDEDPVQAHALALLLLKLSPEFVLHIATEDGLDAAQLSQASEQAAAMHSEYFHGASSVPAAHMGYRRPSHTDLNHCQRLNRPEP